MLPCSYNHPDGACWNGTMDKALDSGNRDQGLNPAWDPFFCDSCLGGGFGKPCNPASGTQLLHAGEEWSLMSGEKSGYSRGDLKSFLGEIGFSFPPQSGIMDQLRVFYPWSKALCYARLTPVTPVGPVMSRSQVYHLTQKLLGKLGGPDPSTGLSIVCESNISGSRTQQKKSPWWWLIIR